MKKGEADKKYEFSSGDLLSILPTLSEKGITEFYVHDASLSANKRKLLSFMESAEANAPDVFFTIKIEPSCLDRETISLAKNLNCSLEIPFSGISKNEGGKKVFLFDKKFFASKAKLLNDAELVFGFTMNYGLTEGDTFKAFRDRLDFAMNLYPNHIDFPQLEDNPFPKATGVFSSKDLDFARGMAFACESFYSAGRAVPWFNTIIKALKVSPSQFFADFDEWEQCNNCSMDTGFSPSQAAHEEIEKMQLVFLKEKFSEKHKEHFLPAVTDMVKLNGAFSRLASDGTESTVETNYNPDDIFSPYALDLASFCENVTMESCTVKIFDDHGNLDYKIL